jgi:hypothetical protein
MHHFSSRGQTVSRKNHIYQRLDLHVFQLNRAIRQFPVVIE